MGRNFIVMGDTTSHGGTVISADPTMTMNGKNVARLGDKVVCRKCRGTFAINSAATDMVDGEGRGYARHGDTTDCGAQLISGQQALSTWKNTSTLGDPAAAAADKADALASAAELAAPTTSGVCLDCLRKAAQLGSPIVIRE
jgi:uncharacterized Zn-binding protein involved in type VI secretion